MWALIEDGLVREVVDTDPKGRFHPSLTWVVCDNGVFPGMQYVEGVFADKSRPIMSQTEVEIQRLNAYSHPVTGSDRYFSESLALQAEGFAASSLEVKEAKAKGLARKTEIQALYPYPVE